MVFSVIPRDFELLDISWRETESLGTANSTLVNPVSLLDTYLYLLAWITRKWYRYVSDRLMGLTYVYSRVRVRNATRGIYISRARIMAFVRARSMLWPHNAGFLALSLSAFLLVGVIARLRCAECVFSDHCFAGLRRATNRRSLSEGRESQTENTRYPE
jgi:hypothetical protein